MGNANMNIFLLNTAALGHHLLANRLRTIDGFRVENRRELRDLPPLPWDRLIILVHWHQLSDEERQHLLRTVSSELSTSLIICASSFSCEHARGIMQSGRCTLLETDASDAEIEDSIWRASEALKEMHKHIAEHDAAAECVSRLTPRERDILGALSKGQSNKGAARLLGLSPRTVEVHRANMIRRSGVRNLAELMQMHLVVERYRPLVAARAEKPVQPCAIPDPFEAAPPMRYGVTNNLCSARPIDNRIGSDC